MKNFIAALLILMLALGLTAGCKDKEGDGPSGQDPSVTEGGAVDTAWSSGDFAAADIDILTSGVYYVKYRTEEEFDGQKIESLIEIAVTGENYAAATTSLGLSMAIIFKDDSMYTVDHTNKTVTLYPPGIFFNEKPFPGGEYAFTSSGSAEFFGATKKYEEYSTDTGSVRFFFEDKNVIGFESGAEGAAEQREILEIEGEIPAGMFDIPTDYEMTDFALEFEALGISEENGENGVSEEE
jgi:hypothetical protein